MEQKVFEKDPNLQKDPLRVSYICDKIYLVVKKYSIKGRIRIY